MDNAPPIGRTEHGRILVVDDDLQIRLLVARILQRQGFEVALAEDGRRMLASIERSRPDLILLDVMLPGASGLDLCRDLRARMAIPVIMLTARGGEADRIEGLDTGADDYVTKPFSGGELIARIKAVLRRTRGQAASDGGAQERIAFDGWTLDLRRRELLSPEGALVDLSTAEFDLLSAFAEHAGRVLSRERLMELAKLRMTDPFDRTIDVQVSRLRRKLVDAPEGGRIIKTVRGVGYMFVPSVAAEA